ncbi:MAG: Gfo/Idh/MocA family oxidoreductase [Chloroflexi bacterium]|nr:Gfo/Idh/MocA family oxidoreductase [Chloroflexota bacterium]
MTDTRIGVAVIGAGMMGSHHAETLAHHVPGARLIGIADPLPGLAERRAATLRDTRWRLDYRDLLSDPEVDAVVIATPGPFHADAIVAAANAGKAVFCEKPIAHTLADADRAITATRAARVQLQVGFQRRFDPNFFRAHQIVERGELGDVQVLRSLTRDPKLQQPERVPAWGVFLETLIHDFDVLRFLSGGAEPVEVFAMADALILPDWKSRGLLDTAVVTLRYDSGAFATADASFQAVYGYDVRAEVFGSAGMVNVGDASPVRMVHHSPAGSSTPRPNWFLDVFAEAYTAELVDFAESVRTGREPRCTGEDGRAALAIARAAIRSVETGKSVKLAELC